MSIEVELQLDSMLIYNKFVVELVPNMAELLRKGSRIRTDPKGVRPDLDATMIKSNWITRNHTQWLELNPIRY